MKTILTCSWCFLIISLCLVLYHTSRYYPDPIKLLVVVSIGRMLIGYGVGFFITGFIQIVMKAFSRPLIKKRFINLWFIISTIIILFMVLVSMDTFVPDALLQLYY